MNNSPVDYTMQDNGEPLDLSYKPKNSAINLHNAAFTFFPHEMIEKIAQQQRKQANLDRQNTVRVFSPHGQFYVNGVLKEFDVKMTQQQWLEANLDRQNAAIPFSPYGELDVDITPAENDIHKELGEQMPQQQWEQTDLDQKNAAIAFLPHETNEKIAQQHWKLADHQDTGRAFLKHGQLDLNVTLAENDAFEKLDERILQQQRRQADLNKMIDFLAQKICKPQVAQFKPLKAVENNISVPVVSHKHKRYNDNIPQNGNLAIMKSEINPERVLCPRSINKENVQIGSNGTIVPLSTYKMIDWRSTISATRSLMDAVFDQRTIATYTLTGKQYVTLTNIEGPPRNRLNPDKVDDIIECILAILPNAKPREICAVITIKCNLAAKKQHRNLKK